MVDDGSSAGGIKALSVLVGALSADFAAPVVIAQHLAPSRESYLEEILSRRSGLPVRTVTGHEPLEPGVVLVVPANYHVNITESEIELNVEGARQPRPSVDLLLSSAAAAVGERLIAVILTGTGTDGAAGAAAVKKAGGTVIIQNPRTAEYPGMPLSLAPSTVDIIAELDRMGPILQDLLPGTPVLIESGQKEALESLLVEVRERNGVDFSSYKMPTILRRLQRRIVPTSSQYIEGYAQYLVESPEEYQQLVNSFLIKVTEFFRDAELFEYLQEEVLPELVEEARDHGNELRLWSAGCATGDEAYSLAIMVCEVLGGEVGQFTVRIFATDIDEDAIGFARNGIYSRPALSNLSEELLGCYFDHTDGEYRLNKLVRDMVVFGKHDLGQRAPFPRIDLVLSRNVLIYFTPELQRRTLDLFAYSLRDEGRLVLGKAESVSQRGEYFEPENREQKVFRRRGGRFAMPLSLVESPPPTPRRRPSPALSSEIEVSSRDVTGRDTTRQASNRASISENSLLPRLPIGVVVVDSHYDIRLINNAAQSLLGIYRPAIGKDLTHLLQGAAYTELRPDIDAALREGRSVELEEFVLEEAESGTPHYLRMVVYPHTDQGVPSQSERHAETQDGASVDSVMIIVYEVTALGRERDELKEHVAQQASELEQRGSLNQRLTERDRQLARGNQDLTQLNEDLQTNNEELALSNEEAQAATEEVETLNEELQVTNEELETLNEELQSTIEELNTTTDDHMAPHHETQERIRDLDRQQAWLSSVLESLGLALLIVDSEGGDPFP